MTAATHLLYTEAWSQFSAKVRYALAHMGISYLERSALRNADSLRTSLGGLLYFPVLTTPDRRFLQDSSDIIDYLDTQAPAFALVPADPTQRVVALLWELYADEFLLMPAMHYRWGYKENNAQMRLLLEAVTGDAELAQSYGDALDGLRVHQGITRQNETLLEDHVRDLLRALDRYFAVHAYLVGARPTIADAAVFGPLFAYLYHDPSTRRMILAEFPAVARYLERGARPDPVTERAAAVGVERASIDALNLAGSDAAPVILNRFQAFETWAGVEANVGDEPPRFVGRFHAQLRGHTFDASTNSYTAYMVQRVKVAFDALPPNARSRVKVALGDSPWMPLLDYNSLVRVSKWGHRLKLTAR